MTVLVRTKRAESISDGAGRPPSAVPSGARPLRARLDRPLTIATGDQHGWTGQRLATDQAVYTCQCGYVFEAPVSTSVGCPHCGGTQAW